MNRRTGSAAQTGFFLFANLVSARVFAHVGPRASTPGHLITCPPEGSQSADWSQRRETPNKHTNTLIASGLSSCSLAGNQSKCRCGSRPPPPAGEWRFPKQPRRSANQAEGDPSHRRDHDSGIPTKLEASAT